MTGPVETMLKLHDGGLRPTAYGPDEDEIRIAEDLPKAETPHEESRDASRIPPAHLTRPPRLLPSRPWIMRMSQPRSEPAARQ